MEDPNSFGPTSDALLSLHQHAREEITRYRDVEWKVPSVILGFLFALTTAFGTDKLGSTLSKSITLKVGFSVLAAVFALGVWSFSFFTQASLHKMRRLLFCVEKKLLLTSIVSESMVPADKASLHERLNKKFALVYVMRFLVVATAILAMCLIWH